MSNLYALCRVSQGDDLAVKRVSITGPVQEQIDGMFQAQAVQFLDGVTEEVPFGTDWQLDPEEILTTDMPAEGIQVAEALTGNPMALPLINAQNFTAEGIVALATVEGEGDGARILIQRFTAQQVLQRKFSLLLDGDTFRRLTSPAFSLDNYLVAIIEGGKLKFKNFPNVKRIFKLSHIYQEATDQQVEEFCAHECLVVENVEAFKALADQTTRKLVFAITKSGILNQPDVPDVVEKATALGLTLTHQDGRLVMPKDKKTIKQVLRFLDDGIYEAPLSARRYMTNSKRPMI